MVWVHAIQFENILTHGKILKVLAIVVYFHSRSQRFFVDVSFRFLNNLCRYTACGNFAILMSLMQHVKGYLLTLNFDFDVPLDINDQ